MCGIIGISAENNVAEEIYESLLMLQHRGQDAAGMVVCEPSGKLNSRKSKGYVRDVFMWRLSAWKSSAANFLEFVKFPLWAKLIP